MVNEEDHLRVQFMFSGFRAPRSLGLGQPARRPARGTARLRLQPPARLPDRLSDQRRHRHPRRRDAPPAGAGPDQADRQGLSRPPEDQPGRPRPVWRGEPGVGRLLPDLQPADPGQERAGADQDPDGRRPPGPPVTSGRPARPCSTERRQHLHDQVSRAYGVLKTAQTISSEETMLLAFERPDGNQPGIDRRPVDRHGQRALHPDSAGFPPEASGLGARRRGAQRGPGHLFAKPTVERPAGTASSSRASSSVLGGVDVSLISFEIDPHKVLGVTVRRVARSDPRRLQAKGQALSPGCRRRGVVVPHPGPGLRDAQLGPGRPRRPCRVPRPSVRPAPPRSREPAPTRPRDRNGPCRNPR